jgi:hypothetical protein
VAVATGEAPLGAEADPRRILIPEDGPPALAAEAPPGSLRITIPDAATEAAAAAHASLAPAAPDPRLTVRTPDGVRPAPQGGRTPFSVYRRQGSAAKGASLAILVTGLGLDAELTAAARRTLPPEVALGFAPYGRGLDTQMAAAAAAGHEVLVELPMEAAGVAPQALGPAGLLTTRETPANARRLDWLLARAPAYPMVTNYLGQTFARDRVQMRAMLQTVGAAGLGYVDDTGLAGALAAELGVPHATVDVLIPPDAADAAARLDAAITRAAGGDTVLVKLYASQSSLVAAAAAIERLGARQVNLVPVSAVVDAQP